MIIQKQIRLSMGFLDYYLTGDQLETRSDV